MMNKVEKFIKDFKKASPEYLEYTFYRGYCYWFALILAERFKGEIWFNPDIVHFAAYIKTKHHTWLYDIYGMVRIGFNPITGEEESGNWMSWEEFQKNNHEAVEGIVASCIKKEV